MYFNSFKSHRRERMAATYYSGKCCMTRSSFLCNGQTADLCKEEENKHKKRRFRFTSKFAPTNEMPTPYLLPFSSPATPTGKEEFVSFHRNANLFSLI